MRPGAVMPDGVGPGVLRADGAQPYAVMPDGPDTRAETFLLWDCR